MNKIFYAPGRYVRGAIIFVSILASLIIRLQTVSWGYSFRFRPFSFPDPDALLMILYGCLIVWSLRDIFYSLCLSAERELIEKGFLRKTRKILLQDIRGVEAHIYGTFFFSRWLSGFLGSYGPRFINDKYKLFPKKLVSGSVVVEFKKIQPNLSIDAATFSLLEQGGKRRKTSYSIGVVFLFIAIVISIYAITLTAKISKLKKELLIPRIQTANSFS